MRPAGRAQPCQRGSPAYSSCAMRRNSLSTLNASFLLKRLIFWIQVEAHLQDRQQVNWDSLQGPVPQHRSTGSSSIYSLLHQCRLTSPHTWHLWYVHTHVQTLSHTKARCLYLHTCTDLVHEFIHAMPWYTYEFWCKPMAHTCSTHTTDGPQARAENKS